MTSQLTNSELYAFIITLTKRCDLLEKEIRTLKQPRSTKINAIQYLNTLTAIEFHICLDNTDIYEVVEDIFNNSKSNGIISVCEKITHEYGESSPIRSLNRHIYIFDRSEWIVLKHDNIREFIRGIQNKLIQKFVLWKREHTNQITTDESFHNSYIRCMNTIMKPYSNTDKFKKELLNIL